MRAAFLTASRSLTVREIDLPPRRQGQLLVRVVSCGVCGSDIREWARERRSGRPPADVAGVSGHEISGIITESGSDELGFAPGDRVVIDPSAALACGRCPACLDGAAWFCQRKSSLPAHGFADTMAVPAAAAFRIPSHVNVRIAALAEPIACGVHAVRHSWTARDSGRIDDRAVVVLGAGMLGLAAGMAARYLGAGDLTIVARHRHQLEAAEAVRADRVLSADGPNLVPTLKSLRPHLVVEAAGGRASTFEQATQIVAWRGEISVLGVFDRPESVDLAHSLAGEHRHFFPVSYAARDGVHDLEVALELMASGQFPVDQFATHAVSLDDIGEAFRIADDKRTGAIRVLVHP